MKVYYCLLISTIVFFQPWNFGSSGAYLPFLPSRQGMNTGSSLGSQHNMLQKLCWIKLSFYVIVLFQIEAAINLAIICWNLLEMVRVCCVSKSSFIARAITVWCDSVNALLMQFFHFIVLR
jgi:hypothetical protein